jgi:hypothetical protein
MNNPRTIPPSSKPGLLWAVTGLALLVLACLVPLLLTRKEPEPASTPVHAVSSAIPDDEQEERRVQNAQPGLTATDVPVLRTRVDSHVRVRGVVVAVGQHPDGGACYLTFSEDPITALRIDFETPPGAKAITPEQLQPFVGRAILVSGELLDVDGQLVIRLKHLKQLKSAP